MLTAEEVSSGSEVFEPRTVNSTSMNGIVVQVDEHLRWEGMLYTLCTTLSFIMFILITSFAFVEANRSLLDSPECIRVVNVQPSLKNAGSMEKIATASVSATKVGDIPSFAGRRRNCGKGYSIHFFRNTPYEVVYHYLTRLKFFDHAYRGSVFFHN